MKSIIKLISFSLLLKTSLTFANNFDPVVQDPKPDNQSPATSAMIRVKNYGQQMNGHIYMASGKGPHPTVIFYHGYPGNEKNIDLMQALRRAGFNTVFFHYRGSWGSEGQYSIDGVLDDSARMVEFVREQGKNGNYRINPDKISLFGHSLGGFAVLHTGANDSKLACTVATSPADITTLGKALMNEKGELPPGTLFSIPIQVLGGYSFETEWKKILEKESHYSLATQIAKFKNRKLFLLAGTLDRVTPIQTIKPLAKLIQNSDGFNFTEIATNHSYENKRIELARVVSAWMVANCR